MASGIGKRRAAAMADGGEAYQQRRREILVAAAEIFREQGYSGASIGDVAARLNTDRASLYYYVGGKRELFEDVVLDAVEANVVMAVHIRKGAEPVPERLRKIISSVLESYFTHYPYMFVFIQEDLSKIANDTSDWARRMRRFARMFENAIAELVQEGIDDGSLRPVGDAALVMHGIIGMINWTHRWYKPDGPFTHAQVAATFADMLLNGLQQHDD
jgi:AcrR family transcriptional regulator